MLVGDQKLGTAWAVPKKGVGDEQEDLSAWLWASRRKRRCPCGRRLSAQEGRPAEGPPWPDRNHGAGEAGFPRFPEEFQEEQERPPGQAEGPG